MFRGLQPEESEIDPIGGVYDNMIATLKSVGYVENEDLYVVTYDWRMAPAQFDGAIDGVIQGMNADLLVDDEYPYAVDYLGHFLRRAAEDWSARFPGEQLDGVDVIAHSTGGLVVRSYIQSDAYGATFQSSSGPMPLPRVKSFVMMGIAQPRHALAWQAMNNNWARSSLKDTIIVHRIMSQYANFAFQKVQQGQIVGNPDGSVIDLLSITSTTGPDATLFIQAYVPTIQSLLATYSFLDNATVNNDPAKRNNLLLDLNAGLDYVQVGDPNAFGNLARVTVIAGLGVDTVNLHQQNGAASGVVYPMDQSSKIDVGPGVVYYENVVQGAGGDGTVPFPLSSLSTYAGDPRFKVRVFGGVDHTSLCSNLASQREMLLALGVPARDELIKTNASRPGALERLVVDKLDMVMLDPVEGFLVDGLGRRLGWTTLTGPVAEIPGSTWWGDADGFGLYFGDAAEPVALQLVGSGGSYYAKAEVATANGVLGVVSTGSLGAGVPLTVPLTGPSQCDGIDWNHDGLFPDTLDIADFLTVFAGGVCDGQMPNDPPCNTDIDFNNDTLFPDTADIQSLLSVFSGGACL